MFVYVYQTIACYALPKLPLRQNVLNASPPGLPAVYGALLLNGLQVKAMPLAKL